MANVVLLLLSRNSAKKPILAKQVRLQSVEDWIKSRISSSVHFQGHSRAMATHAVPRNVVVFASGITCEQQKQSFSDRRSHAPFLPIRDEHCNTAPHKSNSTRPISQTQDEFWGFKAACACCPGG